MAPQRMALQTQLHGSTHLKTGLIITLLKMIHLTSNGVYVANGYYRCNEQIT